MYSKPVTPRTNSSRENPCVLSVHQSPNTILSLVHTQSLFTKHPNPSHHYTTTPSHLPPPTPTHSKPTVHLHLGLSSMRSLFRRMSSGIAFRVSSSKDCMRGEGGRLVCAMRNQQTHARTEPRQPMLAGPYLQAKGLEHLVNVLGPRTNVTRHELVSGREDPRDLL